MDPHQISKIINISHALLQLLYCSETVAFTLTRKASFASFYALTFSLEFWYTATVKIHHSKQNGYVSTFRTVITSSIDSYAGSHQLSEFH